MKLDEILKMRNVPYHEAVGSLMYAAMGTRPDIAFATSTVAQYCENPGWKHWEAVERIFHYLLGMKKLELTYGGEKRGLEGYVETDERCKTIEELFLDMSLWWMEELYPGHPRNRNW